MRIAICDDNESDRAHIAAALAAYLKASGLSAEVKAFDHPDRLLQSVRKEDFDIYLVDILMPMVTGIAMVRELRAMKGRQPVVFFTTSREYAIEAFGVKAIDYVLKPWTSERFAEALDAAVAAVPREADVYWSVKTLAGVRRVRPELITHVTTSESVRNVLVVWLEGGERFELRATVIGLYEQLAQRLNIIAVGKSLLVNPAYICSIEGSYVVLVGGKRLSVPRRAVTSLRAAALAV